MSISDSLAPRKMWSPIYRAVTLAVMFGMVFGGLLLTQPQSAEAQSAAVVTDYLNLRTGPSTDDGIILMMSPGEAVTVDGDAQGGFYPVTFGGNSGYAHADWISIGGAAPPASSNTGNTGTANVIDGALNLRSGASLDNSVITVMPDGAAVSLTGESAGGFLGVVYNGTSGWAWSEFLSTGGSAPAPSEPAPSNPGIGDVVVGSMVVTDSLNVRSGPSTSNTIITTIPTGTTVDLMGDAQGAWFPIRYAGNKGWSHGDWLKSAGSSTPAPADPVPSSPSGNLGAGDVARTTDRLNIRTGPSTGDSVITTLVNGATVEITGAAENGYYPIKYGNTSGWMHGDWLTADGAGVPGPPSEAPLPNPEAPGSVGIGDNVIGTMTVTTGLNLRTGPGTTYDVLTVMPGGVGVDLMGAAQNGYYPVTFHGTKGWASGEYLRDGAPTAGNPGGGEYTRDELIQIIYAAADKYGQPRADMLRVAQCESVLDPNVVNPASGVSGLFQFMPSTWATTPYADQDIFDPVANSEAAAWMWANGRRNEWHCQ